MPREMPQPFPSGDCPCVAAGPEFAPVRGMNQTRFIAYPTNHVVGTIADATRADAAVEALADAGFERPSLVVLHGADGLLRLDPTGAQHGVLERLQRALIRLGAPAEEYRHLLRHVDDVRAGRRVVMVPAQGTEARAVAADILNAYGADAVGFYGRWAWQGLGGDRR